MKKDISIDRIMQINALSSNNDSGTRHCKKTAFQKKSKKFADFDLLLADSWQISCLYVDNFTASSSAPHLSSSETPIITDMMSTTLDDKKIILSWAISLLAKSPAAKIMIEEIEQDGWTIGLENLSGPDFHLNIPEKRIIIDNQGYSEKTLARSHYFRNAVMVALIRALRDVWQENRQEKYYGSFEERYGPETILTLERVRAADLDCLAVLVAWELRSEGEGEIWRYMIGSENGDIAMRFSGFLDRDPTANFTREALSAAFTQWFQSDSRIDACDHETLNYMDDIIESSEGENPFGRETARSIDVERLSCLPDKTAYLQGYGRTIFADPLYAGMNDDINQAHLMHIVYDLRVTYAGNVPFRNADLASRIFPDGMMSDDTGTDIIGY